MNRPTTTQPNGLIPARAGNTWSSLRRFATCWAHPRSRGEHVHQLFRARDESGSSPLARGTLVRISESAPMSGLIPARAGNTSRHGYSANGNGAHPRSRGEHGDGSVSEGYVSGSSPLARGTPMMVGSADAEAGLIPARAGNTDRRLRDRTPRRAHPRSLGEHCPHCAHRPRNQGSSPLARGTPVGAAVLTLTSGLIPARAGNT